MNGISWAPFQESQSAEKKQVIAPRRLVSGSSDKHIKVWEFIDGEQEPTAQELGQHSDWVRDVAWCDSIGLGYGMIASCAEDKVCKVWK